MKSTSSYVEITCAAIPMFANDGTLDEREVEDLVRMALSDNEVDEYERRVLRSIFSQVGRHEVSARTWEMIQRARNDLAL